MYNKYIKIALAFALFNNFIARDKQPAKKQEITGFAVKERIQKWGYNNFSLDQFEKQEGYYNAGIYYMYKFFTYILMGSIILVHNFINYYLFDSFIKGGKSWSDSIILAIGLQLIIFCSLFKFATIWLFIEQYIKSNIIILIIVYFASLMIVSIIRYFIFNYEISKLTKRKRRELKEKYDNASALNKLKILATQVFSKEEEK